MSKTVCAIVPAAGSSARMGRDKLVIKIGDKTVVETSLLALQNNSLINSIVVATSANKIDEIKQLGHKNDISKLIAVVEGGENRFVSVQKAIKAAPPDTEYLCIHDAARPFVSDKLITEIITAAFEHGAAAPCLDVVDTVKIVDENGMIKQTPNRKNLKTIATPQVFEKEIYVNCADGETDAFDDCELLERKGYRIFPVLGEHTNIKITNPEDITKMEKDKLKVRIGHGYDVHKLVEGRKLILGGVEIPHEKGLLGHSDADVLVHAVMDAVVGALALGDIGKLFPDNDQNFKDISSMVLLSKVNSVMKDKGYFVLNIDATILCEAPKLRGYIDRMRDNIAGCLGVEIDDVSVKATTEEGLGFTGNREGIASHAVVLVQKK